MKGAPTAADQRAAIAQQEVMGIHEADEWGEWKSGDIVGCRDHAGSFVIMSFRIDPETGNCKWVNVYGGENGTKEWRSFLPSKVQKTIRKRARRTT